VTVTWAAESTTFGHNRAADKEVLMTDPADEIEAQHAWADDLLADLGQLRELLENTCSGLEIQFSDIYALQTFLSTEEARQVDDRLAPIRRVMGWDPYPNQRCPLEGSAKAGPPSIEQVLNHPIRDTLEIESLKAEVDELDDVCKRALSLDTELDHIVDELRAVVPNVTPPHERRTDEATRQAMITAWHEAAEVLGIEVVAPYYVETEVGVLPGIALLVGVGARMGTLLLDANDFEDSIRSVRLAEDLGYSVRGVPPARFARFDREVFEGLLDRSMQPDEKPGFRLIRMSEPWCSVDSIPDVYLPELHTDAQNTDCAAWRLLLELIDEAAEDGRERFAPRHDMPRSFRRQIVTLPPSIGNLTNVKDLDLYGSNLVAIPPEIGQMTSLKTFTPYTSRRLHWFPYEITRCAALRDSTVSTRNIYGNFKYRMPFPKLSASVPGGSTPGTCSVCGGPFSSTGAIQVWISLRVATDVLPLLVHACSEHCIESLPDPPNGYVDGPHRGGPQLLQPECQQNGIPPMGVD
jgi:hypothetical protein